MKRKLLFKLGALLLGLVSFNVHAQLSESFNSTSLPSGWTTTNNGGSTSTNAYWKFSGNPGYNMSGTTDHTGNGGSFAWVDGSSPYPITVTMTSPALTPVAVPYVDFYLKRNTAYTSNTFTVDYYDGSTWHNGVFTHSQNTANTDWELFTVDLSSYTTAGSSVQVRFNVVKQSSSNSFYDDIALDDIVFYNNAPCIAPPTAGMVAVSDTGVCSGASFTLSTVGSTAGSGMTYQWQSSTNNVTWTNITGATSASYSATQTTDTYYRLISTCSGQSDTTSGFMQMMNPFYDCYCNSGSTSNTYGYIGEFNFSNINYVSPVGCQSYTNTGLTANVIQGSSYPLSTYISSCSGTYPYSCYVKVWIDFNQNGFYNDPGEEVLSASGTYFQTFNGNISIPMTALNGTTGMRISMQESGNSSLAPCASYTWGEVEDYMVNIIAPPANDAGIAMIDTPYSPACVTPSSLWITMATLGTDSLTSATINWSVNGVAQTPTSWTGAIAPVSNDTVPSFVGNYTFVPGDVIDVWTSMPNGIQDSLALNDTLHYTVLPNSLNGTYTIDPLGTGSNNYVDFATAISDLSNSGVCGPVVFNVADGIYNEELSFGTILGASSTNTITFQSASGDTSACIVEYAPSGASYEGVVRFQSGASYIKIKDLGIHNISTSTTYGTAVSFEGNVEAIELESNRIVAFGTSGSGAIYKSSSSYAQDCKFLNNTILNGYYGLYWYGSSSNYDEGTEFIGNEFSGMGYYGNYIWYQSDIKYNNNHVIPSSSTYYAVYNSYFDGHIEINGNFLDTDPSNTYTYYGFYLRYIYGDPYDRAQVYGNRVRTNNYYTSYLYYLDFADVRNNTFVCASTSTGARAAYIYYGDYNVYYNNLFVNLGPGYSIYHLGSGVTEMDNNAYASAGSTLSYWSGANANLSALQSSSGMNDNSVEVVTALSDTLQMLVCNDSLNNVGISTPNYTADFQGDPVDQNAVDIGADQFMLPADFDMVDTTGYCDGDTITLEVFYFDSVIWNYGQHVGNVLEVSQYGSYIVEAYGQCGSATDTVYVELAQPVDLPSVSLICYMDTLELMSGVSDAQSYMWSNGDSNSTTIVTTEGQYSITVVDKYGCESTDVTAAEFTEPVDLADTTFLCESVGSVSINSGMAGTYAWTTGSSSQSINVTADGTYGVTVTDNNNCVTSDETEVVSLADPVADFGGYVLYYNVNFTNNSSGTSYHWDFGDGNTSTDENPSHTYAWTNDSITYYTVTLTVTNACGVDSVTYEVGVGDGAGNGPLGVSELAEGTQVNVYPNPSNGYFNVAFTNVENEEVIVQVYDIQGKQVITRNYGVVSGNQSENLNIENVSAGIYFMNVQIGEQTQVVKLIVE